MSFSPVSMSTSSTTRLQARELIGLFPGEQVLTNNPKAMENGLKESSA